MDNIINYAKNHVLDSIVIILTILFIPVWIYNGSFLDGVVYGTAVAYLVSRYDRIREFNNEGV